MTLSFLVTRYQRIFFAVLVADILLVALHLFFGRQQTFFNLDLERNLPAIYSGLKLLLIGALALMIYWSYYGKISDKKSARMWLVFSALFIYLGFDEIFELHEQVADFLAPMGLTGLCWYDNQVFYWTLIFLPLIILAIGFLIYFIKSYLSSVAVAKKFFIAGLGCFVMVIILEIAGGFLGTAPIGYYVMTLEETFEIFGATMFLGGVLNYLAQNQIYCQNND